MLIRRALAAALAVTVLAGAPAAAGAATTAIPHGPVNPAANVTTSPASSVTLAPNSRTATGAAIDTSVGGSLPGALRPRAVLNGIPAQVVPGSSVTFVLDASTGTVARQELEVTGPELDWVFTMICYGPPDPGCWVTYFPDRNGTYRLTLTAIGPFGHTDSVTESFVVRPLEPLPPL